MGMHSEKNNAIVSFDVRIVALSSRCLWESMSLLKSVIGYEYPVISPDLCLEFSKRDGVCNHRPARVIIPRHIVR